VDRTHVDSLSQFKEILAKEPANQPTLLLLYHQGMYRYIAFYQKEK
jgi:hypothetical protein